MKYLSIFLCFISVVSYANEREKKVLDYVGRTTMVPISMLSNEFVVKFSENPPRSIDELKSFSSVFIAFISIHVMDLMKNTIQSPSGVLEKYMSSFSSEDFGHDSKVTEAVVRLFLEENFFEWGLFEAIWISSAIFDVNSTQTKLSNGKLNKSKIFQEELLKQLDQLYRKSENVSFFQMRIQAWKSLLFSEHAHLRTRAVYLLQGIGVRNREIENAYLHALEFQKGKNDEDEMEDLLSQDRILLSSGWFRTSVYEGYLENKIRYQFVKKLMTHFLKSKAQIRDEYGHHQMLYESMSRKEALLLKQVVLKSSDFEITQIYIGYLEDLIDRHPVYRPDYIRFLDENFDKLVLQAGHTALQKAILAHQFKRIGVKKGSQWLAERINQTSGCPMIFLGS